MWFFKKKNKISVNVKKPDFNLVWNENKVGLSTAFQNGDYEFKDFSGYILLYDGLKCEVEHASFIYHVGNMAYIKRTASPLRSYDSRCNRIEEFSGVIKNGELRCDDFVNSTLNEGTVYCKEVDNSIINNGNLLCTTWKRGTVNGGEVKCNKWLCGIVNSGIVKCEEWRNGIFKGGTFQGEWYGGEWHGGEFQGESFVGDGTVEYIMNH